MTAKEEEEEEEEEILAQCGVSYSTSRAWLCAARARLTWSWSSAILKQQQDVWQ
jgi:hypothetical protein